MTLVTAFVGLTLLSLIEQSAPVLVCFTFMWNLALPLQATSILFADGIDKKLWIGGVKIMGRTTEITGGKAKQRNISCSALRKCSLVHKHAKSLSNHTKFFALGNNLLVHSVIHCIVD